MKITIYTISDCQFSKQEKEYLTANKLAYEEKNLETNKEFLTEMLAISNNFAGTPVTKIEKDDGQIVILKGFTLEEFNKTFNLGPTAPTQTPVGPPIESPKTEIPTTTVPVSEKPVVPPPVVEPAAPPTVPQPPKVETPTVPPADDALKSILNDLQTKAEPTPPPVATTPPVPPVVANAATTSAGAPVIPNFDEK